ncbi:MAG: peptidylprolyl isomerase, partial [Desulfobacterales bacterium]|nr:peptidylprolyl isomerase [Desulfobacterales bacterium]
MQKFIITIVVILFSIINTNVSAVEKGTSSNPVCRIKTSMGDITVELFIKDAPKTVENFISLAEGKKKFTDHKTNLEIKKHYYDNLIFHRVIKNFMIQGGCPKGDGSGDPGYKFEDEINASSLGLDKMPVLDPEKGPHPYLGIQSKEHFFSVVIRPIINKLGIKDEKEFKSRLDEIQKIITSITLKESYEYRGYVYNDKIKS